MPSRYLCMKCHLGFETGWYHYHHSDGNAMAATLLVCSACGASFLLEHKYDGSPDELLAWGGPVTWVATEYEGLFRKAPGTPDLQGIASDHEFRPERNTEQPPRLQGLMDDLKLADFRCPYCDHLGSLAKEWDPRNHTCPRCNEEGIERVGSYIT